MPWNNEFVSHLDFYTPVYKQTNKQKTDSLGIQELGILINLVPPRPPMSPNITFGFKGPEQHSLLPKEPIFPAIMI